MNLAYEFYEDIHGLYLNWHGRDSYDGAGQDIKVSVNCNLMGSLVPFWTDGYQHIGIGTYACFDDLAMHEFTHGVTNNLPSPALSASDEAGAVNEAFSDMWGEWFDQEINYGSPGDLFHGYDDKDTVTGGPNYDWLIGEDYTQNAGNKPARNMKNPPDPGCATPSPDYYLGPGWYAGDDPLLLTAMNSGPGRKLCYLLSNAPQAPDDPFNAFRGFSILPLATEADDARVAGANLFYAARLQLHSSMGYYYLHSALATAAGTLGYSAPQRLNVDKACEAVNIRNPANIPGLTMKADTSGPTVAFLQDVGKLQLARYLTQYPYTENPITTTTGVTMKDTNGVVVAFIDLGSTAGGQMKIKGTATTSAFPTAENKLLVIYYDYDESDPDERVPVTTLDGGGNLMMSGGVEGNHNF